MHEQEKQQHQPWQQASSHARRQTFNIHFEPNNLDELLKHFNTFQFNNAFEEAAKRQYEQAKQQEYSNMYGGNQQQQTQTPPAQITTITEAFTLLQLSQRATVQEVTRKFRSMAKAGEYRHPDAGGSTEQFQRLNRAYEIAKRHAQQSEVK